MKISKGIIQKPRRVMVYGRQGVGKTSWACSAPNPLVIQTEDGSGDIDVHRTERHVSLDSFMGDLRYLYEAEQGKVPYRSLVVDSFDWLEKLIHEHVAVKNGVSSVSDIPYGKGYEYALEAIGDVLQLLGLIQKKHDMNIILVSHARITRFEDPNSDSYDRYAPSLHVNSKGMGAGPLVQEWCDEVFFIHEKVRTREVDRGFGGKAIKAIGNGERVIYTECRPAFDAKSRLKMPSEVPFVEGQGWSEYAKYFNKAETTEEKEQQA
jgi:hypothetical protein